MILNYRNIPTVFASIFKGAFSPLSVTGGAVGSFFMSMKKVYPGESFQMKQGLGTGSIAHCMCGYKKPVKQGFFGIFRSLCRYNCDLYTDGTCHSVRRTGWIWRMRPVQNLRFFGFTSTYGSWEFDIYGHFSMLLCISTIIGWGLCGNTLCGVPAWYPRKQSHL